MEPMTTSRAITRYENGTRVEVQDDVLTEYVLSICLDGVLLVKLICVPELLEELVLGYLYSDGIVSSADDVESIMIEGPVANVIVRKSAADKNLAEGSGVLVTESGDFIGVPYILNQLGHGVIVNAPEWTPETIMANAKLLLEKSRLFIKTGNVHSVMICRGDDLLYFCEDIGRYNAFDKCVGSALKDKTDLSGTCVYTTGRIPSSMALKTLRAGIPMIVSRSAPTDATLAIAAAHGLTVIGFARANKFNLYEPTK